MKIIKFTLIIMIIISCAFNLHAFPKKKHSLIKDEINRGDFENLFELGYYYGFVQFCNFQNADDKELIKGLKGLTAYTHWSLFLVFNRGIQSIEGDLYGAGFGYGSTAGGFVEKPVNWKFDLTGCDTKSLEKSYDHLENLVYDVILKFIFDKSKDDYDINVNALVNLLSKDRKDDYSSIISKINFSLSGNLEKEIDSIEIQDVTDKTNISIEDQLRKLKKLFDEKLITEDEYRNKRQLILEDL